MLLSFYPPERKLFDCFLLNRITYSIRYSLWNYLKSWQKLAFPSGSRQHYQNAAFWKVSVWSPCDRNYFSRIVWIMVNLSSLLRSCSWKLYTERTGFDEIYLCKERNLQRMVTCLACLYVVAFIMIHFKLTNSQLLSCFCDQSPEKWLLWMWFEMPSGSFRWLEVISRDLRNS